MDTVNLLIKPASLCNLRCKYCFYSDISSRRVLSGSGIMTEETLERLVRKAFSVSAKRVVFGFQGGEPTMAGIDLFKRFIELVNHYKLSGVSVTYTIQTNGMLLDAQWAEFFRINGFLVGLSLDGTSALHGMNRIDNEGKSTFRRALSAFELLNRNDVATNILCVVTEQASRRAQSVYNGLKAKGCRHLQFIPCLPPADNDSAHDYAPSPERYAVFLKTLFDLWYNDWEHGDYVSIRLFENYVHILAGRQAGSCAVSGECGQYIVIESDGSVYPCDFYTVEQWRIGDIRKQSLTELLKSETAQSFVAESRVLLDGCKNCKYYTICRGGCKRDRSLDGSRVHNNYCAAFISFFDYAMERLEKIAAMERRMERTGDRI